MSQLAAWATTWASQSSSVLLRAVGVIVAVSAGIAVSVRRAGVSTTIAISTGSPVTCGGARQATGGMRRGWPPAVAVRARGPPRPEVLVAGVACLCP